jgi:CheY-like chemotaxis protein
MMDKAIEANTPYDLLITDMQMPVMDGYVLAKTLRNRGARIPIVALTAHAQAEDRQKCVDAGCDDYLSKPIDKHSLLSFCAKWISVRR